MTDWSQIVAEHGPIVWKTAHRLLSNEADAADCFQRTFLSAVEFARQQPVRHWPALLRRIATSRALEQLRVRIRERDRHTALDTALPPDLRSHDPLALAIAQRTVATHIEHILAKLSVATRTLAAVSAEREGLYVRRPQAAH